MEYEKLRINGVKLCEAFKEQLSDLSEILVGKGVITADNKEEILHMGEGKKADGATRLLELLRNKVKVDPENYHKFVAGLDLKESEEDYTSILKIC